MARYAHVVAVLLPLLAFAGCSAPPPPPPTQVNLTLSATADVNPTTSGQAAPVVVRVYQLASTSGFEGAEFFPLFNQDQSVLKTDLVKKDEFLLSPGAEEDHHLDADRSGDRARHLRGLPGFPARQMARHRADPRPQDHYRDSNHRP